MPATMAVANGAVPPETFDDATRQNIVPLTSVPFVSGGTSSFPLPTSGLGARLILAFAGTLAITTAPTLTPTGPWSLLKRITVRANSGTALIDISGYGLYLMMMINRETFDEAAPALTNGTTAATRTALYNAPVAAGALNFVLEVPFAWNERDDIGLILLQNQRSQITVQITWNTPTGADLTFPYTGGTGVVITGNLSPFLEFFTLPDAEQLFPDLYIAHQLAEFPQGLTSGDNQVSLNRGNTFTKILHYIYNNNAMDTVDVTRMILRYDQNVRPYEINTQAQLYRQEKMYERLLPDGVLVHDLAWQGQPGLGYFRDTIDSEAVSELTSILTWGTTVTNPAAINTVTQQLLHLEPSA